MRTTNLEERATSLERRTTSLEGRVSDSETEINKIKNGTTSVGEAEKAKKLTTARTINGTSFDGSSNITTQQWGIGRNITIDGVKNLIDGSSDITFNTIKYFRAFLTGNEEYIHNGCTKVGEKHLIRVDVSNAGGIGPKVTIKGQGVKQFVIFFHNQSASSNHFLGKEINANTDTSKSYKDGSGFVVIIGVPN